MTVPDLQAAADFIALAEHRSFSRASAARHVTQPAFSRRIKALEDGLSVTLVNRDTSPLTLTAAGERFLQHARNLSGMAGIIAADMQTMATSLPKALHIEMSNSLSSVFFPAWYRAMQRKVKNLSFRLSQQRSRISIDDLRTGRCDFAIHASAEGFLRDYDYTDITQQIIGHDRLVLVKAPGLRKDTTSLITHRAGSYMNACIERTLGPKLKNMKIVFESPTSEFSRGMALAGFGAALLPENLVAGDLDDGYLIPALPNLKPLNTDIMLLRHNRRLSATAEALWKHSRI